MIAKAIIALIGVFVFILSGCQGGFFDTSAPDDRSRPKGFDNLKSNQNGWVSSGGDLFKTDGNPWFLKNVDNIHYCIKYDQDGMSVDIDEARVEVTKAFEYWKQEFARANKQINAQTHSGSPPGYTPLATQEVREVDCDGKEDIAFIFGTKHLTPVQRNFLKDPADHLGVAVRTEYDPVTMRGRGFLYIAADQGDQRYRGEHQMTLALWQENLTLLAMLVHELGHVYGFSHDGNLIMSEGFAENLVTMAGFANFRGLDELPSYLTPPQKNQSCQNDLATLRWFEQEVPEKDFDPEVGLSTNWCIELESGEGGERGSDGAVSPLPDELVWRASILNKETSEVVHVGALKTGNTLSPSPEYHWPADFEIRGSSMVHLTPEQKVFGEEDLWRLPMPDLSRPGEVIETAMPYLITASPVKYSFPGEFRFESGVKKSVYVHISPEGYKIIGEYEGKQKLLFNSTALPFF